MLSNWPIYHFSLLVENGPSLKLGSDRLLTLVPTKNHWFAQSLHDQLHNTTHVNQRVMRDNASLYASFSPFMKNKFR